MEISDLVQRMGEERQRIEMLTKEQEREVADDQKLLLVAICALNLWAFQEIVDTYEITEHACIQLLAKLDRLKLIELLPLNRYRLAVANDFQLATLMALSRRFFREEAAAGLHEIHLFCPGGEVGVSQWHASEGVECDDDEENG